MRYSGTRRSTSFAAGLCLVASASQAVAAPSCVGDGNLKPDSPISVATVAGQGRVPFVKDASQDPACPSTAAACREAAYLVSGNVVVVGAALGDYACATYVGAKGATRTGWLPQSALAASTAPVGLDDWAGTWTNDAEASIVTRRKSEVVALEGSATYGTLDPDRVRRGAINSGEFSADVRPRGAMVGFTQGDNGALPYESGDEFACRVRMKIAPPFLIVEDNGACGGMNVSFTGLYRRR